MMNDPQYRETYNEDYNAYMMGMSIDDYRKYKQSEKDQASEIEDVQKMNGLPPWAY